MPYFGIRFGLYDIIKRWHLRIANGTLVDNRFAALYGTPAHLQTGGPSTRISPGFASRLETAAIYSDRHDCTVSRHRLRRRLRRDRSHFPF